MCPSGHHNCSLSSWLLFAAMRRLQALGWSNDVVVRRALWFVVPAALFALALLPSSSSAQSADLTDSSPCVEDLGTLDASTTSASGSGTIAQDEDCVSSQADADSAATFYARRHTFRLGARSAVSVGVTGSASHVLVIEGKSLDGSGTVLARGSLVHEALEMGVYTVELSTSSPGGALHAVSLTDRCGAVCS